MPRRLTACFSAWDSFVFLVAQYRAEGSVGAIACGAKSSSGEWPGLGQASWWALLFFGGPRKRAWQRASALVEETVRRSGGFGGWARTSAL